MASIEKRLRDGRVRWYVRYRDPNDKQRTKTFDRKVEAEKFRTEVEASKLHGTFIDPARAKTTVGEVAKQWLAGKVNLKATTLARYDSALSVHVLPTWETVPLERVEHGSIQAWLAKLSSNGQSAASVRKSYGVLSSILALAVRDKRITSNPAVGVNLPRVISKRPTYLTAEQVARLAEAAAIPRVKRLEPVYAQYRLAIFVLAYCGLRWSEMAALKVERVDLERRRLDISEAVTEVNGARVVWGTPKNHERRSVPIPGFLAEMLAPHLAGKGADDLVFTAPNGGVLRNRNARRDWFDTAAELAGVNTLTPHGLRHTAASLAVSVGANVKAVQRILGHASAAMTLDRYADLFDDDLDAVAERLDVIARRAACVPDVDQVENGNQEDDLQND